MSDVLDRPRLRYKCPVCGNDDGAAGIRERKPDQRGDWDSKWWVECRKCQGKHRDGDYLKLLAAELDTDPVTLLRSARRLLHKRGLLLDFNNGGKKTDHSAVEPQRRPVLQLHKWRTWHKALLARPVLHHHVGGAIVVRRYRLMYIGADETRRGQAALAFPVRRHRRPVNLIRRYFDGEPRYVAARHGRPALWPDVAEMPDGHVVLVAGMRDAAWAQAAYIDAFTTTAGAASWLGLAEWATGRTFTIAFDTGENAPACRLGQRLLDQGATSVRILTMPNGVKDIAELGERHGHDAIKRLLEGAK
jgi:hypothetical protein